MILQKNSKKHLLFSKAFFICLCCAIIFCAAEAFGDDSTTIKADSLEYIKSEDKYIATGNVVIEKTGTKVVADKAVLLQQTSEAAVEGNVILEDQKTFVKCEKAEINFDKKTGTLYNAIVMLRDQKLRKGMPEIAGLTQHESSLTSDYWIRSNNIQKLSDNHYFAKTAQMTTCSPASYTELTTDRYKEMPLESLFSSSAPDWCFKGDNVDIIREDRIKATNVRLAAKGLPVLYTPAFWMPADTSRHSGLLMPVIGNSTTKGFQFSPLYYWVIDENKDATFGIDYFTKRGLGKSIEYRFLDFNSKGTWYTYHIYDRHFRKDYFQLKGSQQHDFGKVKAFADIDYVSRYDFFKEYAKKNDTERIQKYTQSTIELSMPMDNSRIYLLTQKWIDLETDGIKVPFKLPEIGYFLNATPLGPFMFTMSTSAANFSSSTEPAGQRIDIHPTISHSFGNAVQIFQSLSLRETAYSLKNNNNGDNSPHREYLDYRANALTRFYKRYSSFTHIIEPSVEYRYISKQKDLPVFDSAETIEQTSRASLSLLNTFAFRQLTLSARVTQPYDLRTNENKLSATTIELTMSGPFSVVFSTNHNFSTGVTENVNTDVFFRPFKKTTVSVGERYTKGSPDLFQYSVGLSSEITKRWSLVSNILYDLKGGGMRDSNLQIIYKQQCWSLITHLSRSPGDNVRAAEYKYMFIIELLGVGGIRI
ncbi:MAG: LptA/OstA family protein [Dissulfurispiraceae bacterium]|jgi:LPS-assembly protein|nr:LptA/OstA family protein [Dissulfurispiraceae bacterium]